MGFLKNVFDFIRSPTHSRTTAVIVLFLILAAIPLTVIISQQQQQIRQRASGSEVCSNIDIHSIKSCSSVNPTGKTCDQEGDTCKIGKIIWECQKE